MCVHRGIPQAWVHLQCPTQQHSATLTHSRSLSLLQEEMRDTEKGQSERQKSPGVEKETARKTEEETESETETERERGDEDTERDRPWSKDR